MTAGYWPALDEPRLARYSRQLLVPGFGEAAQQRLAAACVHAVGADAVAAAALVALVQAGIGRLWIEDHRVVAQEDLGAWLYQPDSIGRPRMATAMAALARLSRFTVIEPYPDGGVPSAILVGAHPEVQALEAAESARRAGLPHVVIDPDGESGSVVSVPPGAACYACGRFRGSLRRPPLPGASAVGALAAQELLQLIALPGSSSGRRIDVLRGAANARPTVRMTGCACGPPGAGKPR